MEVEISKMNGIQTLEKPIIPMQIYGCVEEFCKGEVGLCP